MMQTLLDYLESRIKHHPDATSLRFVSQNEYETIKDNELLNKAKEFSQCLLKLGLQPKDRVVLLGENSLLWIIVYFGVLYAGGVIVALDTELLPDATSSLIKKMDATIIFYSESQKEKIKVMHDLIIPAFMLQNIDNMTTIILSSPQIKHFSSLNNNDYDERVATIVNSSGTGGKLKGILLTHQNLIDVVSFYQQQLTLLHSANVLCVLPCYAIYPCSISFAALARGLPIYFADAKKLGLINILQKYHIECLPLVPLGISKIHENIMQTVAKKSRNERLLFSLLTHFSRFLRIYFHINLGKRLFSTINQALGSHLSTILTGGASLNPRITKDFYAWGYTILEGYGLTETAGVVSVTNGNYASIGSCGKPVKGVTITLNEPDNTGCGEILISSSRLMVGYFRDPESNKQAVLANGLLKTGDLGQFDKQGNLQILGRCKEVIIHSDERKVLPDDVEMEYQNLPGIDKLSVVGITDDLTKTDEIYAAVVPNAELLQTNKDNISAIRKHIEKVVFTKADTLPPYLRIKHVALFDRLPINSLGKIKRAEIREKIKKYNLQ